MSFLNTIANWVKKYKRYFFVSNDGFYEFPYLVNSPKVIIQSLKKTPFFKSDDYNYTLRSDNPFLKVIIRYMPLEEGLQLHFSQFFFKFNLSLKSTFNKNLPSDFYHLSFYFIQTDQQADVKKPIIRGQRLGNLQWALFKPNADSSSYHFENSSETYVGIYFNQEWYEKNLLSNEKFLKSGLLSFFESDTESLFWPAKLQNLDSYYYPLESIMISELTRFKDNPAAIKSLVFQGLYDFIELMYEEKYSNKYLKNTNINRKKMEAIEFLLHQNLMVGFPGVENLAKEIGISATKLKTDFKSIHELSLYQYYRRLQMQNAKQLLEEKSLSIKNLAYLFQYESQYKFSLAFKGVHGISPTEVRKKKDLQA